MSVYFDTSSWNHLADHHDREKLIHLIQQHKQLVMASVISVGEVLCSDDLRRQKICSVMRTLHGDGPLLERPFDLAHAAAQAILQGQNDFCLPLTGAGNYLLHCMLDATEPPPQDEIWKWLDNEEEKWGKYKADLNCLNLKSNLDCLPEVLGNDNFLKILCQSPPAKELGVSVSQMRGICEKSDVWKAFGGTLAYMIKPSTTHAPKNKKHKRLPGARDLWQAPYLGVVDVFVTGDALMRDAISEISSVVHVRYPRSVELSESFFERLLLAEK